MNGKGCTRKIFMDQINGMFEQITCIPVIYLASRML